MAKKKLDKEAERTSSSPGKIAAILKNETVHFVIGLMLVIFSVYLLLAFSSFFFHGSCRPEYYRQWKSGRPVGGQQSCEELRRFAWGAVGSLLD